MAKNFATEREYLLSLNPPLAKPGRGRFSKEAKEALAEARKNGVTFGTPEADDKGKSVPPVGEADSNRSTGGATFNPTLVRAWAKENGHEVARRGRIPSYIVDAYLSNPEPDVAEDRWLAQPPKDQPRVRQVAVMYGKTVEGYRVGFSTCRTCMAHISRCPCPDGPRPPSIISEMMPEFDPIQP